MSSLVFQNTKHDLRAAFPLNPERVPQWLDDGASLVGNLLLKEAGRVRDVSAASTVLDFKSGSYVPLSVARASAAGTYCGFVLSDRNPALRWLREKGRASHCLVGLTGIIGAGKSTFSRMLAARGAVILDADLFAKQALVRGGRGYERIVSSFGDKVLLPDGELNRRALASLMFSDSALRLEAEAIIHPLVREQYISGLLEAVNATGRGKRLIVYEAPLLFEGRFERPELQQIVSVKTDEKLCLERALSRGGMNEDEIRCRMTSQMSQGERISRSDIVIDNSHDSAALEAQAESLYTHLLSHFA